MAQKIKKMSKKFVALICVFTLVLSISVVDIKTKAAFTDVSMTLSDSRDDAGDLAVAYAVSWTGTDTGVQCIKIKFRTTATGNTAPTGMLTSSAAEGAWTGALTSANFDSVFTTDDEITATDGDGTATAVAGVTLRFTGITNPTAAGVFYAQIVTYSDACTTPIDTMVAASYILEDGVTVSATVQETLTFTVSSRTTAECDADIGTFTFTDDSTSSTIPFGGIVPQTYYQICQQLEIGTNAASGYSVTVQETEPLEDSTDTYTIADGDCDGSCDDSTSTTWTGTTDSSSGFGYCMDDITNDGANTAGWTTQCNSGATAVFKTIADASSAETAQSIMSSATSTNDKADIMFRLMVPSTQTAAAYTNEVVYIATPVYN